MGELEGLPKVCSAACSKWIKIESERAGEEHRILTTFAQIVFFVFCFFKWIHLRNDGEAGSKRAKAER